MPIPNKVDFTPSIGEKMKDAGLVAADAAWQVSGADKILDLGAGGGEKEFDVYVTVSACEIASNDELYLLRIQGSTSATFASTFVTLSVLELGALEVTSGDVDEAGLTTYRLRCTNAKGGTNYRYVRGYSDVNGTIATGINFEAWMTPGK